MYVNGVIGDIRSPGQDILSGEPTKEFRESRIPKTYFWAYLYTTVPTGQLPALR